MTETITIKFDEIFDGNNKPVKDLTKYYGKKVIVNISLVKPIK